MAARTRFAESCLANSVFDRGVRQLVILGAGLDTLAYRHEYGDQLRVFEVDHPLNQEWKRQRLKEAGIAVPPTLTFVPVDFEREDIEAQLLLAGLKPELRTFFLWLGVVPYLTKHAIQTTLEYIAGLEGGAEVVFDYGEPAHNLPVSQLRAHNELASRVSAAGEPFLTYLDPGLVSTQLKAMKFCAIDDLSVRDLAHRLFGSDSSMLSTLPDKGGHVVHVATA